MNTDVEIILRARDLRFEFSPGKPFLGPIDADFRAGQLNAIVGPNGAGKSTLLRLLVGLHAPSEGRVELLGRPLQGLSSAHRARHIAFLPQHPRAPATSTVEEIVRLGRHPYRGLGLFESALDLEISRLAMDATGTVSFAARRMETLSGGEAQRVHLAAALAQQPDVLALDEPTSDLDLHQELRIMRLLHGLTRRAGLPLAPQQAPTSRRGNGASALPPAAGTARPCTVLLVTHNLNLAMQYCDQVILLDRGRLAAHGPPSTVLTPDHLEPVYGVRFLVVRPDGADRPWLLARELDERGADS